MPSTAVFGHGTLLKLHDGVSTYTTVLEVTDISGPGLSADSVELTSHDSASKFREFMAGLVDAGEISFTVNWQPAATTHGNTAGLLYVAQNRLTRLWQLIWPDSGTTTYGFYAFITSLSPNAPIDDKLSADITIKITGKPTYA